MKKIYAIILAMVMMFSLSMTVYALPSPSGSSTDQEAGDDSPKTGDMSLLFVEVAGAGLAATAIVAAKKSRA